MGGGGSSRTTKRALSRGSRDLDREKERVTARRREREGEVREEFDMQVLGGKGMHYRRCRLLGMSGLRWMCAQ